MSRPATRVTDKDLTHCSLPLRAQGSPNVFVNGLPWSRMGDLNTPHLLPTADKCVTHAEPIAEGSPIVIVSGKPAGRIGLPILSCTQTVQGSPNVLVGG